VIHLVLALLVVLKCSTSAAAQTATDEGTPIAPTATEADYQRVVEQAVQEYIIPAYARLHSATGELGPALGNLCSFHDDHGRPFAAQVFAETVKAWAAVDFLRFGPIAQEGRYERFAFFPDVHGTGARQLRRFLATEDKALLEPSALAKQSAAVQGLPALESLLFSGSKALLTAEEVEPYRCRLAQTIARNLNAIASEALAGWQGDDGWAALMREPGSGNPVYRTHTEAITEVLKAIVTGLEQLREHRLLPALGTTPEESKASRAPYNTSGEALTHMRASANALQRFTEASGILALLPESQSAYANSVEFEFENLESALEAAGPDLEAALADPQLRSKLAYAAIVLQSLRDLFQQDVGVWAGLTAGFNSLDGD
jgi:predicted lipoprotein